MNLTRMEKALSHRVSFLTLLCAVVLIAGFPVVSFPLAADDFANPFAMARQTPGGYWAALKYGIVSTWNGGSFRPFGNALGSLLTQLQLDLAGLFGIPFLYSFAAIRVAVFALASVSVAYVATSLCIFDSIQARKIGSRTVSIFAACTLTSLSQIHALWSNDPVTNYPIAGFFAASIGLFTIGYAIRTHGTPTLRSEFVLAGIIFSSMWLYELLIAIPLALTAVRIFSGPQPALSTRGRGTRLLFPLLPLFTAVSALTSPMFFRHAAPLSSYEGTTLSIGSQLLPTATRALISTAPGAGWWLSFRNIDIKPTSSLGLLIASTALVGVVLLTSLRVISRNIATFDQHKLRLTVFVGCAIVVVAVAIQASTVKIQRELSNVGSVYTFYALGHVVVVLFLFLCLLSLQRHRILICLLIIAVVPIQATVNYSISDAARSQFSANSNLLDITVDRNSSRELRCGALEEWNKTPWPSYYLRDVSEGLTSFYFRYHQEPFC